MGEFSAGRWAVGLLLYFFFAFLGIFALVNALVVTGADQGGITVRDPGFSSPDNIPFAQGGTCAGRGYFFCSSIGIDNETVCGQFAGCYWSEGIFTEPHCAGVYDTVCEDITNESICAVSGCTWTDFTSNIGSGTISSGGSFDWSAVKNTFLIMTGFDATLGLPPTIAFVGAFLFFYLPFFMLLWCLYMALPFLH